MSTLSFSTTTGQHLRGDTQELMNSSHSTSESRGATEYEEDSDEGEADDRSDLESLDVAILTPGDDKQSDPFEGLQPMDKRQSIHDQSNHHHHQQQGNRRSLYAFLEKKRHTKTLSQQSSGATTVKEKSPMEGSANIVCGLSSPPPSSSSSIISQQRQSTLQQQFLQDHGDIHQEMMFASPDYRKSMALSEHSDLALDQSSPSDRGSSFYISDTTPQYTNLLKDATMIIEQQHLQSHIGSQSSEGDNIEKNLQRTAEVSEAGSAIEGIPTSSNKKTITKSRSRRFSAPGRHGSSHTLLSKSSQTPGVAFEYYQGEWDWLPNFDEMQPDNAGIVGNFMIDDTTENDLFRQRYTHQVRRQFKESGNFAVRFTTHIDITQDGVYSFWLSSNDGSVLYVANTLVVENDGMHYTAEAEGRIMLQAGKHPMTVEFFHRNGKMLEGFRSTGPSLVVSYRAPGPIWSFGLKTGPKKVIKSSNLFYDHGGRIMSGDMGPMQPSTRELHVQMENAKATIKDLEQIIRDQAESHKKKMSDLYDILQDTQAQVDRLVTGLKKATLFDSPRTLSPPNLTSNPTWRNTVVSVYVDAEEDYPQPDEDQDWMDGANSGNENAPDSDVTLAKHLSDVEKLKQLYFFSMALSVKMNSEMMGKKTPEYTSTSVQKLYEDCTMQSKIPVEGWPGYGRKPRSHDQIIPSALPLPSEMLVRFRFRFRFEDMNPALSSATNTTRSYTRPPYHTSPPSPSPSPLSKKRVILVKDFHVSPDESGMRLDRFLKHRFDRDRRVEVDAERLGAVSNVLINKWLRKRQIKLLNAQDQGQGQGQEQGGLVSGGQAMSKAVTVTSGTARTEAGQIWRVRALWEINGPDSVLASTTASDLVSSGDAAVDQREKLRRKSSVLLPLQDWVVYKDERMIVLDKPPGIAVQGGTGVEISIDESLSVLQEEYPEKPRIVHRLDSTTSGLLILARTRKAAQDLASRFHNGTVSGSASPATKKDVARGSDIQKKVRRQKECKRRKTA
ncbi:hypothetical protein BGZ58_007471 [Dissophora ornata]|nr:hypothetical protein BGZ58_007471 [Dissophora ornata]